MFRTLRAALPHPRFAIRAAVSQAGGIIALVLSLGGCALYPPADAVRAPGGLVEVEQRFNVAPLDPASPVPLVKQALEQIEKTDRLRFFRGTTYRLTQGNRLPPQWLLQTPDVWGRRAADVPYYPLDCENCDADFRLPACVADPDCDHGTCAPLAASVTRPGGTPRKFCVGHSDRFVDVFYRLIVSAQRAVDITMLAPPADGRFRAALRNAVTYLAASGQAVRIRFIIGDYPLQSVDAAALLQSLIRDAKDDPHSRLRLYVGAMRSCNADARCDALSWNHAKIVAVDGRAAIVGGHNMWSGDYLADAPVHDISMMVEGPAAEDAHGFADALWDFLCDQPKDANVNAVASFSPGAGMGQSCLSEIRVPRAASAATGGVPILAVGRLAEGITHVFADQSLIARDLMLGAATQTVRMMQEDVAFSAVEGIDVIWLETVLDRLARLMVEQHVDVYIVLSNDGAAGPVGDYSNHIALDAVATKLRDLVAQRGGLDAPAAASLVCQKLHLAPLRFGPDATWPNNTPIGMHAKFWMVDERAFYIGSENLYPSDLQEFGYIVEDHAAAAQVREDYWDEAWRWSRAAAISGADAPRCVFAPKSAAPATGAAPAVKASPRKNPQSKPH
jgi:phosphatidylserine/phosphatidylglycerophosphate/cardiolipin synthase-like enzyme